MTAALGASVGLITSSGAAEPGVQHPWTLSARVIPPFAGVQIGLRDPDSAIPRTPSLLGFLGFSGSLRLNDLWELDFGDLGGLDVVDSSSQVTGRAGVEPTVWASGIVTVRIPFLAGFSYLTESGGGDETSRIVGHSYAPGLASGLELNLAAFDLRLLANGGWQWASLKDTVWNISANPNAFTFGATLELGVTLEAERQTYRRGHDLK